MKVKDIINLITGPAEITTEGMADTTLIASPEDTEQLPEHFQNAEIIEIYALKNTIEIIVECNY